MINERSPAELKKLLDSHPRRELIEAAMGVGVASIFVGWPATAWLAATMLADTSVGMVSTSPVLVLLVAICALIFSASYVLVDMIFYEGQQMSTLQRLIVGYLGSTIVLGVAIIVASLAGVAVPTWLRLLSLGLGGIGFAFLGTYFLTRRRLP